MSTTKSAYLFGPIAGLDFDEAQDWRAWMRQELASYGIDAFSPMRGKEYLRRAGILSGHGRDYPDTQAMSSAQAILARDKFDVLRADVLVGNFLGAKRVSIGSMFEMAWAHLHHKPVIVAVEDENHVHDHLFFNSTISVRVHSIEALRDVVITTLA
jgi:nucleoside 2-deoxyribosyltransferase